MKRQWKVALCLALATATLTACGTGAQPQNPATFAQVTQNFGPTSLATQTPEPMPDAGMDNASDQSIFSANPYDAVSDGEINPEDAMNEEGYIDPGLTGDTSPYDAYASAEGTVYPYAGSTPIPLDPVDMPSPTPRPKLSFVYVPYAASIGVSFEGPVGWQVDESQPEIFILSEPENQVKDGQRCILTVSAIPVTSNYTEANLKTEVTQRLDTLGSANYASWKPSRTASRYLMGSKGVYANYSGTLTNDVNTGGRIHFTCVDKVLYSLEIVYPLGFKDDYLAVFAHAKDTLKRGT
ncbi:MAG: hypothetical protein RSA65_00450 [Clostridia bacterium]